MGTKSKQAATDEGWMREAWEWAGEIAESRDLAVYGVFAPTPRKGVWRLKLKAVLVKNDKIVDVLASTEADFPNGRASTLAALVFVLATELSSTLEQTYDPQS